MIVEQYAAKFIELSHFGPHLILIKAKKSKHISKGVE